MLKVGQQTISSDWRAKGLFRNSRSSCIICVISGIAHKIIGNLGIRDFIISCCWNLLFISLVLFFFGKSGCYPLYIFEMTQYMMYL